MKKGQVVWVPSVRKYGYIHEISWDKTRIKSVELINPGDLPKIINVINLIVEAVGIIEQLVMQLIGVFRKNKKSQ